MKIELYPQETVYCGFPQCENEAAVNGDGNVQTVRVSLDCEHTELRPTCAACEEIFTSGVQHGRFRAMRRLLKLADGLSSDGYHAEAIGHRKAAAAIDGIEDPADEDGEQT